jgi:hypothetical protein
VLYCDTPAALKRHMPGALIVITSPNGREARTVIAKAEGVSSTILVGDGVHAVVDDAGIRIPQLRAALQRAGVAASDITVGEPSIEDVFVALLEDGGKSQ